MLSRVARSLARATTRLPSASRVWPWTSQGLMPSSGKPSASVTVKLPVSDDSDGPAQIGSRFSDSAGR